MDKAAVAGALPADHILADYCELTVCQRGTFDNGGLYLRYIFFRLSPIRLEDYAQPFGTQRQAHGGAPTGSAFCGFRLYGFRTTQPFSMCRHTGALPGGRCTVCPRWCHTAFLWRGRDSNAHLSDHESEALPLSYPAVCGTGVLGGHTPVPYRNERLTIRSQA